MTSDPLSHPFADDPHHLPLASPERPDSGGYLRETMSHPADFRHRFVAARQIPLEAYERACFFACAPLPTFLVALIIDNPRVDLFAPDYELIARIATARAVEDVDDAIADYWDHPANARWLRRFANIRLSTRQVRRLARALLPCRPPGPNL